MANATFVGFADHYIEDLEHAVWMLDVPKIEEAAKKIRACQGTVWLIGNGGSAALASHMATDLQLAGVRAISLTDVAAITTYGNDFGYHTTFQQQIEYLAKAKDILICISGSGNSENLINAARWACTFMDVIAVTGFDGGKLKDWCHLHLHAPASHIGQAQDLEQVILHIICYWLMEEKI